MKVKEFNEIYKMAEKVDVVNNEWFNCMGWFWLNLTDKQIQKMFDLMNKQNNMPLDNRIITFRNGMVLHNNIQL